MANRSDRSQTPLVASVLGLQCLQRSLSFFEENSWNIDITGRKESTLLDLSAKIKVMLCGSNIKAPYS